MAVQPQALRKYRRVFKLGEGQSNLSKEELMPAVLRHWQTQVRRATKAVLNRPPAPPGTACTRADTRSRPQAWARLSPRPRRARRW